MALEVGSYFLSMDSDFNVSTHTMFKEVREPPPKRASYAQNFQGLALVRFLSAKPVEQREPLSVALASPFSRSVPIAREGWFKI